MIVNNGEEIIASNSLPFILAQTKEKLKKDYIFYDSLLASIRYGLKNYIKRIPIESKKYINVYYCCNIIINVNEGNNIIEIRKNSGPEFYSYEEIINYLKRNIDEISLNANDKMRCVIYKPLATLSSGYDSSACAALAKEAAIKLY